MPKFGAIVYSPSTRQYGYSWDFSTPDEAKQGALSHCQSHDATVLACVADCWLALALSPSGAYGWAYAHSSEAARNRALFECRQHNAAPYIEICFSTTDGQRGPASIESATNIDEYWLDDNALARISRQVPSTNWGKELMRDAWPKRYPDLLSSDTYRGCAIVLSMLLAYMRGGISVREIQQLVEGVDQSLKASRTFQAPSDLYGGASLTVVNAWTTAADLGFTAEQIAAAYESELIYVAQMFLKAR